jgi:membrane protease YdiL (CAAX protease family)
MRILGSLLILFLERLIVYFSTLNLWRWIALQTVLFTALPVLFIMFGRLKREEIGLCRGNLRLGLKYVGVMLVLAMPFMVYGASLDQFKDYYPIWEPARRNVLSFILLELGVFIMMFNTEFYFRGLLLFSLKRRLNGKWIAIFVHSLIYMLVHIGKPGLEVPYSFFVGIVFAWVALKTRSFLPTLIAHWTSSVIFDLMVLLI